MRTGLDANAARCAFVRNHSSRLPFKNTSIAKADAGVAANTDLPVDHDDAQLIPGQRIRRADNDTVAALVAQQGGSSPITQLPDLECGQGGIIDFENPFGAFHFTLVLARFPTSVTFGQVDSQLFHAQYLR